MTVNLKKYDQKGYMKKFVNKTKDTTRYCKLCNDDIKYFSYSKHCKSKKHLSNEQDENIRLQIARSIHESKIDKELLNELKLTSNEDIEQDEEFEDEHILTPDEEIEQDKQFEDELRQFMLNHNMVDEYKQKTPKAKHKMINDIIKMRTKELMESYRNKNKDDNKQI